MSHGLENRASFIPKKKTVLGMDANNHLRKFLARSVENDGNRFGKTALFLGKGVGTKTFLPFSLAKRKAAKSAKVSDSKLVIRHYLLPVSSRTSVDFTQPMRPFCVLTI